MDLEQIENFPILFILSSVLLLYECGLIRKYEKLAKHIDYFHIDVHSWNY